MKKLCVCPRLLWFVITLMLMVLYCEFLHYYVVLIRCVWPNLELQNEDVTIAVGPEKPLKIMVVADTHLLGFREGHWFDKLRREWQMERTYQTSMLIHSPDMIFFVGDLFDEGKWCSDEEFHYHVKRFNKMFKSPSKSDVVVVVGNHDIGFHHMISDHKHERFEKAFNQLSTRLLTKNGNAFILVNSMAMEGDGCSFCFDARAKLKRISKILKCWQGTEDMHRKCLKTEDMPYTRPILIQHFPMYRLSDVNCTVHGSAPSSQKRVHFQEKWDCLSKEASRQLFKWIKPRLIISAHTHYNCYREHPDGTPEWTVGSLSWRNHKSPSFLLAVISNNNFSVRQCMAPDENTVIHIYIFGSILALISLLFPRLATPHISFKRS